MLSSSNLDCDMYSQHQSQKPQRPKLQSFQAYESHSPSTPSGPSQLIASCQALQSMLGGPTQPVQSPSSRSFYHPNSLLSKSMLQPPLLTPPCSSHKRGREEYEEDSMMFDAEENSIPCREQDVYQMPKRQRPTALDVPLGLHMADNRALQSPRTPQLSQIKDIEMCLTPSQDALELDPMLHHISHKQLHSVQSTTDQNFLASGHDYQLTNVTFASANQLIQNQFEFTDPRIQQTTHSEQQWMSFSGEGNIGLSVR